MCLTIDAWPWALGPTCAGNANPFAGHSSNSSSSFGETGQRCPSYPGGCKLVDRDRVASKCLCLLALLLRVFEGVALLVSCASESECCHSQFGGLFKGEGEVYLTGAPGCPAMPTVNSKCRLVSVGFIGHVRVLVCMLP